MSNQLQIEIEELYSQNADDFKIAKAIKKSIKEYLDSLDDIFDETSGKDFFVKHTKKIDEFLKILYKYIIRKYFRAYQPMSNSIPITLVALGSYGREQLCVYSDVDLMLLYEDIPGYNIRPMLEEFLTLAWDSGLKLGHRVHELKELEEVVKTDITIKTSILESRLIYGSKFLWFGLQNNLKKIRETERKEFILEKYEEHSQRLRKYPLSMEPNIKDGYGGMRETNTLFWFVNVLYGVDAIKRLIPEVVSEEDYKKYRISLEYIFRVRNALHLISKKKNDVVNFDILPELSTRLGFENTARYTKERQCSSKLFNCLHSIHFFCATMSKKIIRAEMFEKENLKKLREHRYKKNLYIDEGILYTSFNNKEQSLQYMMKEIIELPNEVTKFDTSYVYYLSQAIKPSKQTKELKSSIKTFFEGENIHSKLKLLYNAGQFLTILPSMKQIKDQPQFDGYHKHPVDIHSLKCVYYIENIKDEFVKNLYDAMDKKSQSLLKVLALFHDVGKGRGKDHHVVGENIYKKFAKSIGLDEKSIELGALIVKNHNTMSYMATTQDIYSQRVILIFTGILKSVEALKLLYVLTYADISSVGENIYKSTTANLLRELFLQAILAFENEELVHESSRVVAKQNAIKKKKLFMEQSKLVQKKILNIGSNQMFLKRKADDILEIALWAKDVDEFEYRIINDEVLKIQIARLKHINLGYILGKMSQFLNITSMDIFKLYDDKKYFEIVFSEKVDESELPYIEEILKNPHDMQKKVKIKKPVILEKDIKINCEHTKDLAQLNIQAKDQKGLFAYIAKVMDSYKIVVESAKIYTSKNRVRDMFLIEKDSDFCDKKDEIVKLLTTQEEN